MTSLTTRSDPTATPSTRSAPAPAQEPVLITEQQVLWGTAVARSATPAKKKKQKAARRQYPKRYAWLDNSLMGREMDRL